MYVVFLAFPGGLAEKNPCNAGVVGGAVSISGLGRSPGGGHGNPLQYSFLENPTERRLVGYSPCCRKELDTVSDLAHTQVCGLLLIW